MILSKLKQRKCQVLNISVCSCSYKRLFRVLSLILLTLICYDVIIFSSEYSTARRQNNKTKDGDGAIIELHSDATPAECIINSGKAVVHEKDPILATELIGAIDFFKMRMDQHEMPNIETIGPSFYFQTKDPRPQRNWPALSRGWNDTYAVIDDKSIINAGSDIWGSQGLGDEIIIKAKAATSRNPVKILEPGKYAAFSGWYVGNFGHYLHDHVSKIAWLKSLVSDDTKFLLPFHELHKKILTVVDDRFVKERVIWVQYDETVHANEGSLTIMIPKLNYPFRGGFPQTGTIFTEYLRRWLEEAHWSSKKSTLASSSSILGENKGKVIFYTRRGSTDRRVVESQLEEHLIQKTIIAMKRRGQTEKDLIIFSGHGEDGNILPLETQFELFSSADLVIGPHGSGLANVIWMDPRCSSSKNRPKVLEFASSGRSPSVQTGSYYGYWFLYGSLPWIDYHQLYYTSDSTDTEVFIDPQEFEETLNSML